MLVEDRKAMFEAIKTILKDELGKWGERVSGDDNAWVSERLEEAIIHRVVDAIIATRA